MNSRSASAPKGASVGWRRSSALGAAVVVAAFAFSIVGPPTDGTAAAIQTLRVRQPMWPARVFVAPGARPSVATAPTHRQRKRNVNVSDRTASQNEATVAVSPLDANDILAASNDLSGPATAQVYESFDGGQSWALVTTGNTGICVDPWLHFNDSGDAFFAYVCIANGQSEQRYAYRLHGTGDWVLTTFPSGLTGTFPDRDMITTDDSPVSPFHGSAYIGFDAGANGNAYVLYSRNGRTRWTRSPKINDASTAVGVNVSVAPDGTMYATWLDYPHSRIMSDLSTDGGATWGTDHRVVKLVTDTSGFSIPIPPQEDRGIVLMPFTKASPLGTPHAGRLYVAYEDERSGGGAETNVYVTHSDNGSTWSTPVQVNDDTSGAYQFFPAIAVAPNGTVGLSFYDTRNDPTNRKTDQYFAFSSDGGKTWSTNTKVTTAQSDESGPHDPSQYGDYEGMDAGPTNLFAEVWTDSRSGDLNEDLYFARVKPA